MGTHKISLFVEVLAWLSFFLMLILNISLVSDISFGDSEWIGSLRNIATEHLVSREMVTYGLNSEAIPAEEVKTLEITGTRIDKTLPGNDLKSGKDLCICPKLT